MKTKSCLDCKNNILQGNLDTYQVRCHIYGIINKEKYGGRYPICDKFKEAELLEEIVYEEK